jgi:drug/metabolite transporter (DMT)-like permease
VTLFDERPDIWTLTGAAIIIASGIYTFWRERRLARRSPTPSAPVSPRG